ncbi:MAG TPA: hypothetical protein VGM19_10690 [Armatimonadota bacterium]|jgi:hypothetical protein
MTEPLFSARQRAHNRNLAMLLLLLAGSGPYGLAFAVLTLWPGLETTPAGGTLTAVALLLSAGAPWLVQGRLALLGNRRLQRELARRYLGEAEGEFVGWSPGERLRSWEGETDQDVGFLACGEGELLYRGDQFTWSLRREQIDRLELQGVTPDQLGASRLSRSLASLPVRIAVFWHGPRDPGRVFTLASRDADTVTGTATATLRLHRALLRWREEAPLEEAEPIVWGLPPTDERSGVPLDRPAPGSCLSALSLAVITGGLVWQVAGALVRSGFYNRALLWAGLLLMTSIVLTGHILMYLQLKQKNE